MTTTPCSSESESASTTTDRPQRESRGYSAVLILLALLPVAAAWYFTNFTTDQPALTVTRRRPALHFASFMYHHGAQPVEADATLESEFRFRNVGTVPVTIGQVERSCGCMTPLPSKRTLAPGEVGSLRVPIQTISQSPGPHEYMLTMHYTDPEPQQVTLTIKATFPEKMVVVQPKTLYLSQSSAKSMPFQIAVTDFREDPLRVTEVLSTASFMTAQILYKSVPEILQASHIEDAPPPDARTEIAGEVEGNIPPGTHHVLVAAVTDDPEFPVVTVPMTVYGPKYEAGKEAVLNAVRLELMASDHSSARREGNILLTAPESWNITHATAWPPELDVRYESAGQPVNSKQITRINIRLAKLPTSKTKDGVVQLIANGGKNLVTVKVSLVWP